MSLSEQYQYIVYFENQGKQSFLYTCCWLQSFVPLIFLFNDTFSNLPNIFELIQIQQLVKMLPMSDWRQLLLIMFYLKIQNILK